MRSWTIGKFEDICREMKDWEIDVLSVVQTNLREDFKKETSEFMMIGKGRSKFEKQGGGLGIIVRKSSNIKTEEYVLEDKEKEAEDIICINIEYNRKKQVENILLIVVYMTVQGRLANIENKVKYSILNRIINNNKDKKIMVLGDMNGHTGILDKYINPNGEKLLNFAEENNMEILNHTIAQGKVTWSSNDMRSAIDYVLVNEKASETVKEMWIDEEGWIDIDTDHNMIVLNIEGSKSKKNTEIKVKKNNKWKLTDVNWDNFQVDLAEIDILYYNGNLPDQINKEVTRNIKSVAKKHIKEKSKVNKNKNKSWWNKDVEQARNERKISNREYRKKIKLRDKGKISEEECNISKKRYTEKQKEAKRITRETRAKEEKKIVDSIRDKGEENGRDWYRFLKGDEYNENETPEFFIVNGEKVLGKSQMTNEIEKFWKAIGGDSTGKSGNDLNFSIKKFVLSNLDHEISIVEIREYVKKLKKNKSPGIDEIPYEMYKNGGEWVVASLYELFKGIWWEEKTSSAWNTNEVILIHEGGGKLRNRRIINQLLYQIL